MEINITFRDGEWLIQPDPATVKVGESITWIVRAERSAVRRLRWTIYFDHGVPFLERPWMVIPMDPVPLNASLRLSLSTITLNTGMSSILERDSGLARRLQSLTQEGQAIPDHGGATEPITTERPGTYKYGVKLENVENGELLGDDDPTLFVV